MMIYLSTVLVSLYFFVFTLGEDVNSKEFDCSDSYLNKPFCRYTKGDCQSRIVINAPHGGTLKPPDVPPRLGGCLVNDKCVWKYAYIYVYY